MNATRTRLYEIIDMKTKGTSQPLASKLSIASLSIEAGISRTAIYRYYPDVVERVRRFNAPLTAFARENAALKLRLLKDLLSFEKTTKEMLSKACVELLAEITELRQDLKDQQEGAALRIASLEKRNEDLSKVTRLSWCR